MLDSTVVKVTQAIGDKREPFSDLFLYSGNPRELIVFLSIGIAMVVLATTQRMNFLKAWYDDPRKILTEPNPMTKHELHLLSHIKQSFLFIKKVQNYGSLYFIAANFFFWTMKFNSAQHSIERSPLLYKICSNLGFWFTAVPTFILMICYLSYKFGNPKFTPDEAFLLAQGKVREVIYPFLIGKKRTLDRH
jgi:hypothetical protein